MKRFILLIIIIALIASPSFLSAQVHGWWFDFSLLSAASSSAGGGWTDDGTDVRLTTASDNVNIGVANGTGKLNVLATTEQLRLSYDATNYMTVVLLDDGHTTFTTVDPDGAEADINFAPDGKVGIKIATPDGTLHIHTGTAGAVVAHGALDDLTIENGNDGGISILTPDAKFGYVGFGSPGNQIGATLTWNYSSVEFAIITNEASSTIFSDPNASGAGTVKLGMAGDADLLVAEVAATFNEAGADYDFRIETAGEDSALVIDGADGDVYMEGLGSGVGALIARISGTDEIVEVTDATIGGSLTQETYVIRKHVALSGATDNSATNIFTITTTDETGSADGGMYSVHVQLTVGEAVAASGAVNTASVGLGVRWTRIMASAGTGANSAVIEIGETASANEGSGSISLVTVTVTETSEFIQQVLVVANTSGGTFDAFCIVELIYSDFTTAPTIQ